MTQEEKAKAYDEAVKRAKEKYAMFEGMEQGDVLEDVFPELAESEDEKIRKALIRAINNICNSDEGLVTFNGFSKEQVLAWLEKQGEETSWKPSKEEMDVLYGLAYITEQYDEHKEEIITRLYQDLKREFFNGSSYENMFPNTEDGVRRRSTIQVLEYARSLDTYNQYGKADIDKNIAWLEKQGQTFTKKDVDDAYLKGVCDTKHELEKQGEQKPTVIIPKFKIGDVMRTIQEAADGIKDGLPVVVSIDDTSYRCTNEIIDIKDQDNYEYPPINRKHNAWSEEDERLCQCLIKDQEEALDEVRNDKYGHSEIISDLKEMYHERIDWLKSLKDRVGCEVNCTTTKEWSEDDEAHFDSIIKRLEEMCKPLSPFAVTKCSINGDRNWLKALKGRYTWKPSDEQMKAIRLARSFVTDDYFSDNPTLSEILIELENQLKKLK